MSRARQVAVVAAVAGTLLLATSSAAPQPWSARVVAARIASARTTAIAEAMAATRRPAAPYLCFANRPCPGPTASICFASAVVREPACPPPQVTYHFAQPQPRTRLDERR